MFRLLRLGYLFIQGGFRNYYCTQRQSITILWYTSQKMVWMSWTIQHYHLKRRFRILIELITFISSLLYFICNQVSSRTIFLLISYWITLFHNLFSVIIPCFYVWRHDVKVQGYFAWSLLDNFEWIAGYTMRFGINFVDYKDNLKRHHKLSSHWFRIFLKKH